VGICAHTQLGGAHVHQHRRSDPHPDPAHHLRLLGTQPIGGFGKRIGDGTSEAISRRNDIGVGNSLVVTEEKLERALAKLEEGSYGRCDGCGGPIAPGRLEAAPESALCIECAR
jgi:hypothetical protein